MTTTATIPQCTCAWEEGCSGAAVTARKKRVYEQDSETESVCACVCAQDKWISAIKQHWRHVRDTYYRAAANENRFLQANHNCIHKLRQMNHIITEGDQHQWDDQQMFSPADKFPSIKSVGTVISFVFGKSIYGLKSLLSGPPPNMAKLAHSLKNSVGWTHLQTSLHNLRSFFHWCNNFWVVNYCPRREWWWGRKHLTAKKCRLHREVPCLFAGINV